MYAPAMPPPTMTVGPLAPSAVIDQTRSIRAYVQGMRCSNGWPGRTSSESRLQNPTPIVNNGRFPKWDDNQTYVEQP